MMTKYGTLQSRRSDYIYMMEWILFCLRIHTNMALHCIESNQVWKFVYQTTAEMKINKDRERAMAVLRVFSNEKKITE